MCGEVADEWRSDPAYASAGLAEVFAGESAPVPNLFAIATFDFTGEPSALAQWLNPTPPANLRAGRTVHPAHGCFSGPALSGLMTPSATLRSLRCTEPAAFARLWLARRVT
jgi:hypothetical protein